MPKYTVYGDLVTTYKIDIEADSSDEAYELANNATTDKWTPISTDSTIAPYEVYLDGEELENYPELEDAIDFTQTE